MCQKPNTQNKTQYGTIYSKFKNLPKTRWIGFGFCLLFLRIPNPGKGLDSKLEFDFN